MDRLLADAGLPPLPRTAWLEIDLDALVANLAAIRSSVPDGVRVEPVVKADAYGHGAVPVARALESAGADGLCVATLDEAVALRDAGIALPLLVLYPVPADGAREAAERGIAITAGDAVLLDRLVATAARWPAGLEVAVHAEVDTGLGRGGFPPAAVADVSRSVERAAGLRLAGLWTHLQDPGDPDRTARQVERFAEATDAVTTAGSSPPARHVAASGALLFRNAPPADAVRPGLITYGIVPDDVGPVASPLADAVRPVMSLRARPVRVADLPVGHGVSYGPSWTTPRASRIATLPLGYGDGWPRALSNRAVALVRGVRAPLVGNVAMDAVMADVTDVPGDPVSVDDVFTLLGEDDGDAITAAGLAQARNTNAWEVVTAMAARLPRVYHAAAGAVGIRTLTRGVGAWPGSSSGTGTSATSRSTRS